MKTLLYADYLLYIIVHIIDLIFQSSGGMSNSQSAHDVSAADDDDGYGEIGVYARRTGTLTDRHFYMKVILCLLYHCASTVSAVIAFLIILQLLVVISSNVQLVWFNFFNVLLSCFFYFDLGVLF